MAEDVGTVADKNNIDSVNNETDTNKELVMSMAEITEKVINLKFEENRLNKLAKDKGYKDT